MYLRETFSTSIVFKEINKYGKGTVKSVSARLQCYLPNGPLKEIKRDFFDIYLTTFLGIRKFENALP